MVSSRGFESVSTPDCRFPRFKGAGLLASAVCWRRRFAGVANPLPEIVASATTEASGVILISKAVPDGIDDDCYCPAQMSRRWPVVANSLLGVGKFLKCFGWESFCSEIIELDSLFLSTHLGKPFWAFNASPVVSVCVVSIVRIGVIDRQVSRPFPPVRDRWRDS